MRNTNIIKVCVAIVFSVVMHHTYAQILGQDPDAVTYDDYLNNIEFYQLPSGETGVHIFNDRNIGPGLYLLESTDGFVRMGIGTRNPEYHFTNVGTTLCKEISIEEFNVSEVPDYVFEDDYDLMPLAEVERYVKENHHLPEIASEEEMLQNGMELGDMGLKLLLKIEELTLHTIAQNKLIDQLETELLELEK